MYKILSIYNMLPLSSCHLQAYYCIYDDVLTALSVETFTNGKIR